MKDYLVKRFFVFVMFFFTINSVFASIQEDSGTDVVATPILSLGSAIGSLIVDESLPALPEGVITVDVKVTAIIPSKLGLQDLYYDIAAQGVIDPQASPDSVYASGFFNGSDHIYNAIHENAIVIQKQELPLLEKSIMEKGIEIGMKNMEELIEDSFYIVRKESQTRKFDMKMETSIPRINPLYACIIKTDHSVDFLPEDIKKDPVKAFQTGYATGESFKENLIKKHAFILHKDDQKAYENRIRFHEQIKSKFAEKQMERSRNIVQQEMQRAFEEDKIRECNKNLRNGILIGATLGGVVVGAAAYFYSKKV